MRLFWMMGVTAIALAGCSDGNETPAKPGTPATSATETASTGTADTPRTPDGGKRVFWGDTHLHTADSPDAFAFGTRLSPEDALRFARGDKVVATGGLDAQLDRPLDFLVIADHAVALGLMREIYEDNPKLTSDPVVAEWRDAFREGGQRAADTMREIIRNHSLGTNPEVMSDPEILIPIMRSVWQRRGDVIEAYNDPGTFTAFVGYEFTPAPDGDNQHRVVVFRDGPDVTSDVIPFSSGMSEDPADLWAFLEQYESDTGGQVLAIPHNSNLSGGTMFAFTDFEGNRIDAAYARTRARWEPIVEVTQYKGDSESHSFLSPADEFAGYGDAGWDRTNLIGEIRGPETYGGDYAREALKRGLQIEAEVGTNPFQFGMIGATDSHTGLATADEDNFFGKFTTHEPNAERASAGEAISTGERMVWQYLASGLAGVWAEDNTREAIFDAMMRREVYATTGPRMTLRVFAGTDLSETDLGSPEAGYAKGVAMGGNLGASDTPPTFLIEAAKDPMGANLDRVQVVKGWYGDGELQETIYDVAWGGNRRLEDGKLPPVGDTVEGTSYTNSIGAPALNAVWTDPDFDPDISAFYYVRMLEIPTPYWTAYDAERYGAVVPDNVPASQQERAYSSPIWYSPN